MLSIELVIFEFQFTDIEKIIQLSIAMTHYKCVHKKSLNFKKFKKLFKRDIKKGTIEKIEPLILFN
jgi:hypothetical protein